MKLLSYLTRVLVLLTGMLVSADFVVGDTITLRMNQIATPSKTIQVAEGQVVKLIHFYCFPLKGGVPANPNDGIYISNDIALTVSYDDLTVQYTHEALYGKGSVIFNHSDYNGLALSRMPEFAGPVTIKLDATTAGEHRPAAAICTIEITPIPLTVAANEIKSPSVAPLVVPEKDGPVEILLESSTDLQKTWQPAAPGVYGTAVKKRFFRLRAEPR